MSRSPNSRKPSPYSTRMAMVINVYRINFGSSSSFFFWFLCIDDSPSGSDECSRLQIYALISARILVAFAFFLYGFRDWCRSHNVEEIFFCECDLRCSSIIIRVVCVFVRMNFEAHYLYVRHLCLIIESSWKWLELRWLVFLNCLLMLMPLTISNYEGDCSFVMIECCCFLRMYAS